MTTVQAFTDEISDQFLVCKICFQIYDKPKTLSCLHVFCTSCLEKYLQAELERTQYRYVIYARCVTCPICRKRTEISSGGIRALPDNFLVSNLTELVNRSKPVERHSMCDFCSNSGKSKVAQSRCVECAKNMCQPCMDLHKRTRVTRHHSVFDVKAEKSVVCKVHLDEPLRFFCQPCETCICVACTFREHQGHEVSSFGEGIQKYAGDVETMIGLCSSKIATIQTQLDIINRFEANMNKVEEQIKTLASNLVVNIRMKQRNLLDELRHFYGSEALELLDNREELEQILENLSSTCDLAQFVLKDRNVELLLLHKEVREKMKTLIDCELPDLPDTMFKELKFIQGAMFFGYLNSGQELRQIEYDVKPSPLLHPEILARLSVTSSVEETQTSNEQFLRDVGTTMDSDMVNSPPSICSQTEDPLKLLRRGSTQTEKPITRSTGTTTDIPIFRSRSQNTDKPDIILANCGSQTNVDLIDAFSQCHPVLYSNGVKTTDTAAGNHITTQSVACDTGIRLRSSGTSTEDLETELINRYLEMLDGDEPHSPPYNIPFPVDIFDRHSPTSETMPVLSHLLSAAHKTDDGHIPSIADITGGNEIEVMDVMVKDSSTDTDDLLPKFTDNPIYTYSDSCGESSPEDYTDSSDNCRSSDEEKMDQSTFVDKDDLIQLLAGEALVNWDERSALHDMIVLDRLNQQRNMDYIDSCMNTESVPLASRSVMTDAKGSRTVATITVANITCDVGTNARVRKPRRETVGTLTDLIKLHDTASDAYTVETADFGNMMKPMMHNAETEWQDLELPDAGVTDDDFKPYAPSPDTSQPNVLLETSHLSGKLQGLFSMSKLQELTQKLEKRPHQTPGLVSSVTKKLERQMSGELTDISAEQTFDYKSAKPARRWSTSSVHQKPVTLSSPVVRRRLTTELPPAPMSPKPIPVLRASKDIKIHPSPPSSPKQKQQETLSSSTKRINPITKSKTFSFERKPEMHVHFETKPDMNPTQGIRKQLARMRKPDITALLSLSSFPVYDSEPLLLKRSSSLQARRQYQMTSNYMKGVDVDEKESQNTTESSSQSGLDISSASSMDSFSDWSSSLDDSGTPVLTPFTDDSQSPVEDGSRTTTPIAGWNIDVSQNSLDGSPMVEVREISSSLKIEKAVLTEKNAAICSDTGSTSNTSLLLDNTSDKSGEHQSSKDEVNKMSASTCETSEKGEETDLKPTDNVPGVQDDPRDKSVRTTWDMDDSVRLGAVLNRKSEPVSHTDIALNRISIDSDNFEEIEKLVEEQSFGIDGSPTMAVSNVTAQLADSELSARAEIGLEVSAPSNASFSKTASIKYAEGPSLTAPVNVKNVTCSTPIPEEDSSLAAVDEEAQFEQSISDISDTLRYRPSSDRSSFVELSLPLLSESEVLDSSKNYRSLSPRPKMGKMPPKTLDLQRREEPPRVVLGVSGIGAMPRSKSLNTIEAKEKSDRADKKSFTKTFQSLFKSKSKDSKSKRNSSVM